MPKAYLGTISVASTIALLSRVSVSESPNRCFGFGPLGLLGVVIPVIVIRHVYGLYRKLQNSGRELLDLMVKAIEARDPYTSGPFDSGGDALQSNRAGGTDCGLMRWRRSILRQSCMTSGRFMKSLRRSSGRTRS